jgi:hypothetical protein
MRTLDKLSTRNGFRVVGQEAVAGKATRMRWLVDDSGRVASLNSHPAALWASAFDQPLKAILELGFICIEDRSRILILALHTSKVKRVTLAGTFYYLAHQNAQRIIIYSNCGIEPSYNITISTIDVVYRLLEEAVLSGDSEIPSITNRQENKTRKRGISYARSGSPPAHLCRLRMLATEQSLLA